MKEWRTEYKILLYLGIMFLIVLLFFLIKTDSLGKLKQNYKEKQLVSCTTQTSNKGIEYTDYTCNIKDENGNSYTISYPQIKEKSDDIKNLNKRLKSSFNEIYNSVTYFKNSDKLVFDKYQKINYKIYNSRGIVSFLIENQDMQGNILNTVNQYRVYNIDLDTFEILDIDDVKKKLGINRDYSSSLKGMIVKMYIDKFRYDYNNELDVYRNAYIDQTVEDITFNALDKLYIDDDSNVHFILYLFNPSYGEKIPYNFTIDRNNNTTYELIGYE